MTQWSVYIDIDGFSATYEAGTQALVSLGALMTGIYNIGTHCYRESPDRLFAHQLGDGFIIVGEFGWPNLEQASSITIALLRTVLVNGGVAKAAISEGNFADITGCYPEVIRNAHGQAFGGAFPLGGGLMTVLPVMGTALINAYKLLHSCRTPSGSLLVVRRADAPRLPAGVPYAEEPDIALVDWIHASHADLDRMLITSRLPRPKVADMAQALNCYIEANRLSEEWVRNTRTYLSVAS